MVFFFWLYIICVAVSKILCRVPTCHRACQRRRREIREGSCPPRTAGPAARGGAKTAWHMSSSDTPSPPSFSTGSDRRHESPLAQWGVDGHLTTPHLHGLYHAWPPTGDNHLIANRPTGDAYTQRTQEGTQKHKLAQYSHKLADRYGCCSSDYDIYTSLGCQLDLYVWFA